MKSVGNCNQTKFDSVWPKNISKYLINDDNVPFSFNAFTEFDISICNWSKNVFQQQKSYQFVQTSGLSGAFILYVPAVHSASLSKWLPNSTLILFSFCLKIYCNSFISSVAQACVLLDLGTNTMAELPEVKNLYWCNPKNKSKVRNDTVLKVLYFRTQMFYLIY